ncbi:LOW QUALITY PROTEIN: ubiquitin carboxyl-terminal hydrolase 43 [Discoglossus pictus]
MEEGMAPKGSKKLFRRKSLKSVGHFMQRILRTLSSLSHLGQEGERGPRDSEDDDGGFKEKDGRGTTNEDCRLVQGGDNNNNLGRHQDRLSWDSEERVPGVQGLKNHGNTCFMNAVVQCLSNTDLLAEYLGMEQYRDKGEGGQPAGPSRGEVTDRLACLVRGLWTLEYTPQLSVDFKNVVSQYGAQFRGNSQHDALEFLLWLLDRVHEDLNAASGQAINTAAKSPSSAELSPTILSTSPQTTGGQSFVQEHFQAQYRSSLTCPHCHKQSDTFDPFLCVSLPIPLRQTRALNVTLVFQSKQQRFLRVGLAAPLFGTVATLRQMVADEGKMPPDQVILAELYPTGFQRSFSNDEDLNTIAEGDPVYAFQAPLPLPKVGGSSRTSGYPHSLPTSPRCSEPEGQHLPGTDSRSSEYLASTCRVLLLVCNLDGSGQQADRFGPPLLVREERTVSWEQLQQCILGKMRYLMRPDAHPPSGASLFHIRVVGGPVTGSYLSPKDPRPLNHPAVDRALHTSGTGGPPHVKLHIEWDPKIKERLFGSIQEEVVHDAESVRTQNLDHQQQSCTLSECFSLYTKEEQLALDDAWRCPYCKVLQQGTVKLSLWTLPDILIIHLKRFRQVGGRRNKLSTLVRFPLNGLDMAPHVVKRGQAAKGMLGQLASWKQPEIGQMDVLYDLYAVCNHHGSLQGGHYTAYCRNSLDARWYSYDDSSVEPVPEDEVCTRGAYILFYQKRNAIPVWSASSSVRGSTSSSISDHWALRLSGSKRESLVSRTTTTNATTNATPLPRLPDSPVFLDKEIHADKGCIGTKSFVRGIKGRSASMKVSSASKFKLNISKAVPLRWSFGSKDRAKPVTGELVEYLESGRRPKFTNDSIVPVMTEKGQPKSTSSKVQGTNGNGKKHDSSQAMASVGATGDQAKQSKSSKIEISKSKAKDKVKLPESATHMGQVKVEVSKQPKPRTSIESTSGMNASPTEGFVRGKTSLGKKPDNNQRTHHKAEDNTRTRPSEAEGQHDGKSSKTKSSFVKKEPRKHSGSEISSMSELPNGAPRTTLSNGMLGNGRTSDTMPHRHKEGIVNGKSQVDIRRAHSSSNVQNKEEWSMKRSASQYKNGSMSNQPSRQMTSEKPSSGTLQRMRYQTSSLGRKKTVPESSF